MLVRRLELDIDYGEEYVCCPWALTSEVGQQEMDSADKTLFLFCLLKRLKITSNQGSAEMRKQSLYTRGGKIKFCADSVT
jgi:hypothetical protein